MLVVEVTSSWVSTGVVVVTAVETRAVERRADILPARLELYNGAEEVFNVVIEPFAFNLFGAAKTEEPLTPTRAVTGLVAFVLREEATLREAVPEARLTTPGVFTERLVVVRAVVEREDATAREDAFVRADAPDADDIARDAAVERLMFVRFATFLFAVSSFFVSWTTLSSSFITSSVYSIISS